MDTLVTLPLPTADANTLKATEDLATNQSTTFITYTSNIANDLGAGGAGTTNPAQPAVDGINPVPARTFTPDTHHQYLQSLHLLI